MTYPHDYDAEDARADEARGRIADFLATQRDLSFAAAIDFDYAAACAHVVAVCDELAERWTVELDPPRDESEVTSAIRLYYHERLEREFGSLEDLDRYLYEERFRAAELRWYGRR